MHASTKSLLRYFRYHDLPEPIQSVATQCAALAAYMAVEADGPEVTAGLRKLLEAKDCFLRAMLPREEGE